MRTRAAEDAGGLPVEFLDRVGQVLRLLAHPQRLRIVEILGRRKGAPVHEITELLDLPQAATSQHLNQMRRMGVVSARRRGREVWYSIADRRCIRILECVRTKAGKS